jgi:protocatechuate 3,4-dioxygenase beta subunit
LEKTAFLRGLQRTDASGWVEFLTIFPGWYEGRVPHIHFKVFVEGQEQLTSQFYLDQTTCDRVYTTVAPYNEYGKCPLSFENDIALRENAEAFGLLLKPSFAESGQMLSVASIGIRQA